MALDTPEKASKWSDLIAMSVRNQTMPPWPPASCEDCPPIQNSLHMNLEDRATLVAWGEAGGPVPNDNQVIEAPPLPGLDRVDISIEMPAVYSPKPSVADDYRCFVVDLGLDKPQFMTGYNFAPGNLEVVHHGILYTLNPATDMAYLEALENEDPEPGYDCFGGPGVDADFVAGWAPGIGATSFPEGTGIGLEAGQKMILEIHYNLLNGSQPDQTSVELMLEDSVERPSTFLTVVNSDLALPPGEEEVIRTLEETLGSGRLYGVVPHMHTLGTIFQLTIDQGDGDECLIELPNWDFNWQSLYLYEEAIEVNASDSITLTCAYDTTSRTEVTNWGEGTEDEMCVLFLYVSN